MFGNHGISDRSKGAQSNRMETDIATLGSSGFRIEAKHMCEIRKRCCMVHFMNEEGAILTPTENMW